MQPVQAAPASPTAASPLPPADPPLPVDTPVAAEPTPTAAPPNLVPTLTPPAVNTTPILYNAQAADSLPVLAVRFGVDPSEIQSAEPIPETAFLHPGQLLIIPRRLGNTTSPVKLMPDSEVVFSPSATGFDIAAFVDQAGGKMSSHREWLRTTGVDSGADVVLRVARENSINPRLLLALIEYQSGWIYGQPATQERIDYPLGKVDLREKGLYHQLVWAVNQLSYGYYTYREGRLTTIRLQDGTETRLAPDLNAGTAALQYYFAQLYDTGQWLAALDPQNGFPAVYERMFGNPWERAQAVEPLFPPGLAQPALALPFLRNWQWSFTGGPHGAWEHEGAFAALDFAPGSTEPGCIKSNAWVTAAAAGLVVRSGPGVVVLDLDGDGHEQTGWVLLYLHIATEGRAPAGTWLAAGEPLGHPSCEGGFSTGTHLHIARKYNGEWIPAGGPLPFNLGGWVAQAGDAPYKGTLTRGEQTITACTCASAATRIIRNESDP